MEQFLLSLATSDTGKFIGGGGFAAALLWTVWYLLQRQERELNTSRVRVDHFGEEMYVRWQKESHARHRWQDAYNQLYWRLASLSAVPEGVQTPHQIELDLQAMGMHEE